MTQGTRYQVLACSAEFVGTSHENAVYQAFCEINNEMETYGFQDPLFYQASIKSKDPDMSTYFEVMMGDDHEQFCEAKVNDIKELEQKNTWTLVKHSEMKQHGHKTLASTWAFRQKVTLMALLES